MDFSVEEQPERRVVFVRVEVRPQDNLGDAFGRILPRLQQWVTRQGLTATLPPFGRYLTWDGATMSGTVDIGIGVEEPTEGGRRHPKRGLARGGSRLPLAQRRLRGAARRMGGAQHRS